jgi:hypothetical protein
MVALAWRSNSAIGLPKTSTSSLPQALTRTTCAPNCPFFRDLDTADQEVWVHRTRDNLEAFVNRGGLVKVAFFGGLDTLQRVEDPRHAAGSRVQVASLADIAGMKMRVIPW